MFAKKIVIPSAAEGPAFLFSGSDFSSDPVFVIPSAAEGPAFLFRSRTFSSDTSNLSSRASRGTCFSSPCSSEFTSPSRSPLFISPSPISPAPSPAGSRPAATHPSAPPTSPARQGRACPPQEGKIPQLHFMLHPHIRLPAKGGSPTPSPTRWTAPPPPPIPARVSPPTLAPARHGRACPPREGHRLIQRARRNLHRMRLPAVLWRACPPSIGGPLHPNPVSSPGKIASP